MMKTRSVSIVKDEIKVPTPIEFHKVNSRPDESEMNDDLIGHCYYCDGKISIWTEKGWSEFGGNENGVYVAYFDEFATDTYDTIQEFLNDDKKSQLYIEYKNWLIPASVDGENYIVSAYFQEDNTIQEMRCECTGRGWTMMPVITDGSIKTNHIATGAVTTDKIANSAVTLEKLAESCINTPKILDNAVTKSKIATGAHNPYIVKITDSEIATVSLELTASNATFTMDDDCYNAINNTSSYDVLPDVILPYGARANNRIFRFERYDDGSLKTVDFGDPDNYSRIIFTQGTKTYKIDGLGRLSTNYVKLSDAANTQKFTGKLNAISGTISVNTPSADTDAANKKYVDDSIDSLNANITDDVDHRFESFGKGIDYIDKTAAINNKEGVSIKVSTSENEQCYIIPYFEVDGQNTLSIDSNLKWLNGDSFGTTKMSTGKTYMISVYKNLACWGEFS